LTENEVMGPSRAAFTTPNACSHSTTDELLLVLRQILTSIEWRNWGDVPTPLVTTLSQSRDFNRPIAYRVDGQWSSV
jgi:hypothetical protein